jgi:two-component system NtrC family sensor kinase
MHRLLERQLRRRFAGAVPVDARLSGFLEDVDTAYHANDSDRALLERSIELASAELLEQNERLARDLVAIKELELELRQADKLRAVGQLAAGISHEINTPIQFVGDSVRFVGDAVLDLLELGDAGMELCLSVEAGRVDPATLTRVRAAAATVGLEDIRADIEKALRQTTEGLQRVSQIVQAMKQFGRPDQRQKVLADINRCLLDTLVVAASEVRHVANVTTSLAPIPLLPCYPSELSQVFLNLIVNAAHAIAERFDGSEHGRILVSTEQTSDAIVVSVADNGSGIDPLMSSRIFEPFFTTKVVGRGTGQGLAISRSIVTDKHGGTLSFQSKVGEGTTFVVKLPLMHSEAARSGPLSEATAKDRSAPT